MLSAALWGYRLEVGMRLDDLAHLSTMSCDAGVGDLTVNLLRSHETFLWAERKAEEEDAPPVFKLSTNAIKGKFSMMNGLFDPQGGVGTGVGCM